MKILKLEIKNIRGIPDFNIEPEGKSLVIYGPNGSGKSAVIDALDFLLTGKIARLVGEGTEDISLKEYGPHIDKKSDLTSVEVNAIIKVPDIDDEIHISRTMQNPNELIYDNKYKSQLSSLLELLNRGQYVFTRREILKLITSKSSTRAQEIQKVLKLTELEDIRLNLVKVFGEYKRELNTAESSLDTAKQSVLSITGHPKYETTELLNFINEQRQKLGGEDLKEIDSSKLKEGIGSIQINPSSVNHKILAERCNNLKTGEIEKDSTELKEAIKKLHETVNKINEDSEASWNSKRYSFTVTGIKLLRDSGECPLCDEEWAQGDLKKYLQARVDNESVVQKDLEQSISKIDGLISKIKNRLNQLIETLRPVSSSKESIESNENLKKGFTCLSDWNDKLLNFSNALKNPVEKFNEEDFPTDEIEKLYSNTISDTDLDNLESEVKVQFPEATPEQTAWDNLTKLSERIKNVEESQETYDVLLISFNRASLLGKKYVEARNEVLESLYDKIKDRFVGLYKEMHGSDEDNFDASFAPQDSGLKLKVDFYGRGLHPPNAMHSEGHQDSMGICLFLALSEYLNSGLIDLTILDDVVMSVDIDHRRSFCSVLAKNFNEKQLIITTHETAWANQLRFEGVVESKQMLNFFNWNVDTGPILHYEAEVWKKIETDLNHDDVNAAAAKLRRGLEEFTRHVCHNLRAPVPYIIGDGGSLGDFVTSAIGQYKRLLKKAKGTAQKLRQQDVFEKLSALENEAIEIINRTQVEQWMINPAVHYNEWGNFSKNDFKPVVKAFDELCNKVFSCESCGSAIRGSFNGASIDCVKCKCGNINWNIVN
ncbi:MAG: AAA family ATPase [Bacteroidales bacterium]|nr:AAA family ATPase [Bacteroidales bacterium]